MAKNRGKNSKGDPATRIVTRGNKKETGKGRVPDGAGPDEETRVVGKDNSSPAASAAGQSASESSGIRQRSPGRSSEEYTRLVTSVGGTKARVADTPGVDAMDDPVVGWLVIIDGPGKGAFVRVGYGVNSIGRDSEARISLDFGDEEISRVEHASVTYDGRGRKFYLQQGTGNNLVYIGDDPVLNPRELMPGDEISIGGTVMRFVPFCGAEFEWNAQ